MSHASLLVAVDPCPRRAVEQQVEWNMEPFCENNTFFRRGSRWDWYIIGGRWDGLLVPHNIVRVKDLPAAKAGHFFPPHYAFLRARRWNEPARMGWFGAAIKSECELDGQHPKRCLTRDPETKAAIVTWNEKGEVWDKEFYARFVKPLDPRTWLVTVDYHV